MQLVFDNLSELTTLLQTSTQCRATCSSYVFFVLMALKAEEIKQILQALPNKTITLKRDTAFKYTFIYVRARGEMCKTQADRNDKKGDRHTQAL